MATPRRLPCRRFGVSLAYAASAVLTVLAALLVATGVASAHDVTTRFEAPIPLDLLYAGAGATVALTALLLSVSARKSTESNAAERLSLVVPAPVADAIRLVARVGFFGAFVAALVAGLVGTQTPAENVATVFVWALWLKGIAVVAALVGDPWPALSPWRTVYDGLTRLEGEEVALFEYPEKLGDWPAVVGFLAVVGVLENLTVVPSRPATTAVLLAVYAAVMVLGAVAVGPEWLRRADFFAVLYRLFGRVAPLRRERVEAGVELSLRAPWRGCRVPVESGALAAFVVATVYTVSFDGFASTPEYRTLLFGVRDATGLGPGVSAGLYLLGFVGFLAAFVGVAALTRRIGRERGRFGESERTGTGASVRSAATALAPTVLPIAVGYELAHNAAFVLTRFGDLVALLGGPDLALLSWLSLPVFWTGQVLLVVAAHVVAVVAAHGVVSASGRCGSRAARTHAPLTALMVGYTVLSLWIISRPVVA